MHNHHLSARFSNAVVNIIPVVINPRIGRGLFANIDDAALFYIRLKVYFKDDSKYYRRFTFYYCTFASAHVMHAEVGRYFA